MKQVALPPPLRTRVNHNNTEKFRIVVDCQQRITDKTQTTQDWLTLSKRATHDLSKYAVFYGILDKEKDVVVKVGPDVLRNEYAIGTQLASLHLPTYIQYHCLFECMDTTQILYNKHIVPDFLCRTTGKDRIHALVMPTIHGNPITSIQWNRASLIHLKTVLKHIICSLFLAVNRLGFVHGDLHTGNILIQPITSNITIEYAEFGTLPTLDYLPVIMDFDMSVQSTRDPCLIYKDIRKYIQYALSEGDMRLDDTPVMVALDEWIMQRILPSVAICTELCKHIDSMPIKYVYSELPIPNFSKHTRRHTRRDCRRESTPKHI